MAPGTGINFPCPGYMLDVEWAFASVHVKLVQAVYCAGGF